MPNIEIHMTFDDITVPSKNAMTLEKKIWQLTEKLIDEGVIRRDDLVISHRNTQCWDRDGNAQPFIRILSTHPSDFDAIADAIAPLKLDIECIVVDQFYLKGVRESAKGGPELCHRNFRHTRAKR